MNFLELCKKVFIEGGISGQITSTQNQTGEAARVVGWVADAYREILNDQEGCWKFLKPTISKQLTPGVGAYSFDDLNIVGGVRWDLDSMRVAISSDFSDETFLHKMNFRDFRDYWLFSSRRDVQARPINVAVNNETALVMGPVPAEPYWLSAQCVIEPPDLINDDDVPVFPARFHKVIVWLALRHYGMFEAAPEAVSRADLQYKKIMQELIIDQTPEVEVGGPLC